MWGYNWGYNLKRGGIALTLTDTACKSAKPKDKPYKLADSGGLYLQVMPNGSKYWRLKYRFLQKEKLLAIGTYPFLSLAEARKRQLAAKELLNQNIDPSDAKRDGRRKAVTETECTFKAVALEWHAKQVERWSKNHAAEVLNRLERDIFPQLGRDHIARIEAPHLLAALRKIEKRGALDLVGRVRQICGQVFRYGIQTGKCKHNPAPDLYGAFRTRKTKHFDAIEPKDLPELLQAIQKNDARLFSHTRRAIVLSLLTFVRPSELRKAVSSEFDFEKKEWRIPAERMKARVEHIVPLSKQAITILKEQLADTERLNTNCLFPCRTNIKKPMSDNTVRLALHKMGFKNRMTAHGFRALARTAIREELNYEPDVIEAQLAHKPAGPLGAAYDRAKFLKQRQKMMQEWADHIDNVAQASNAKVLKMNVR